MTNQLIPPERPKDVQAGHKTVNEYTDRVLSTMVEYIRVSSSRAKSDSNDPEALQAHIRQVDAALKLLAQAQRDVGKVRKDLSNHNETLRRANPKGRVQRGGSKPFLLAGKWYVLDSNNQPLEVLKPQSDERS